MFIFNKVSNYFGILAIQKRSSAVLQIDEFASLVHLKSKALKPTKLLTALDNKLSYYPEFIFYLDE